MTTTGRSESINAFIKRFISSHTSLMDFFKQTDVAIKVIELKRTHNNLTTIVRPTSLKTRLPLEEQAFQVVTPVAFKKFHEEIEKASQYSLVHEDGKEFILKHYKSNGRMHTVFWDGSITLCSCKNFEFWGILCRHVLRVFIQKDCFHIPPCYLALRWCSDMAESSGEGEEFGNRGSLEPNPIQIDENLRDGGHVLCPPKSKTKGHPRKIRLKGGKEQAKKQIKSCSICKQSSHTKPTCPLKVTLDQGVFNAFEKRQKVSAKNSNPINTVHNRSRNQQTNITNSFKCIEKTQIYVEAKSYSNDIRICQAKSKKTTPCSGFPMSIWISGACDDWKNFLVVSPTRGDPDRRNGMRMMEEHHGFRSTQTVRGAHMISNLPRTLEEPT
ncbi:hypothetical protein Cgig2_010244 [Carnegiea gigantea]|uniref:Protein FAR1-RELATED SEQUENCE n=1 Tax=Carnegiea gigantea TaxID=171969 RepID=A0A9Q1GYJ9_9CARY|nr:hypothetical protein Cgig2_010244 [Carnegiea gigantea]